MTDRLSSEETKHSIRVILWIAELLIMLVVFYVGIVSVTNYYIDAKTEKLFIERIPGIVTLYGFLWSLLLAVFVIMTYSLRNESEEIRWYTE